MISKNLSSQALAAVISSEVEKTNATDNAVHQDGDKMPSPETRGMADVLGGLSQSSRIGSQDVDTQMGVENILGNNDDWSQASGMQRLIEARTAESNFMPDSRYHDAGEDSQSLDTSNELPAYQTHDGEASGLSLLNGEHNGHHASDEKKSCNNDGQKRKSILSRVMEKADGNKGNASTSAFPSTPTKAPPSHETGIVSSLPNSLTTPAKAENPGAATTMDSFNPDVLAYFMRTPGRGDGIMSSSPAKAEMMPTPSKVGHETPLSQYEKMPATLAGCNSLLPAASVSHLPGASATDFDIVQSMFDLRSNSAPNSNQNTPTKPPMNDKIGGQLDEATKNIGDESKAKSLFGRAISNVDRKSS